MPGNRGLTLGNDIKTSTFNKLLLLVKTSDDSTIFLPKFGEQNNYPVTALYEPSIKFMVVVHRKGHIQVNNLTIIMKSRSAGIMYRFDVFGAPHNGITTPHLHIFDSQHNGGSDVISGTSLTKMNLPATNIQNSFDEILLDSFIRFLKLNNVILEDLIITLAKD